MTDQNGTEIVNYLTVDVEDYFQVSAFEDIISSKEWLSMESRVARNTEIILQLFDKYSVKATFFIVGWIAERFPDTVKRIQREGHDIACHSYWHRKVYDLTPDEFKEDTVKAKNVLEDITGQPIKGYRAPSYSITANSLWALDILEELDFSYDSSIFPITHDTYGIPESPRFQYQHSGKQLVEYPISTVRLFGYNLPASGGGYFRLFPYAFSKMLFRRVNQREKQPFMFYFHPWEIDPEQPRMQEAKSLSKFRHYNNLDSTVTRLERLLQDFSFVPISS